LVLGTTTEAAPIAPQTTATAQGKRAAVKNRHQDQNPTAAAYLNNEQRSSENNNKRKWRVLTCNRDAQARRGTREPRRFHHHVRRPAKRANWREIFLLRSEIPGERRERNGTRRDFVFSTSRSESYVPEDQIRRRNRREPRATTGAEARSRRAERAVSYTYTGSRDCRRNE